MSYYAYVTRIKNLRKHPNADRLQLGECFGNTVCVDLSYEDNQLGVYFPTDGQLSEEFAGENNLLRVTDANGNNIGGYMDPDKRNVKAIKLRGEKSDGLFLPLKCLDYICDSDLLEEGFNFTVINGHEICQKYIPKRKKINCGNSANYGKKKEKPENIAPLFVEHVDTEQLVYHLDEFKKGDLIEITLKMHGTSQRTAYLPILKGFKKSFLDYLKRQKGTPIYEWDYITGTRRTICEDFEGGFYGNNDFRKAHAEKFRGKLRKGEEVYYEVVGYVDKDTPVMPRGNNNKVQDKNFVKQYGNTTTFSYGCGEGESDLYVYRMTMTNEDGDIVEYSPDLMRYRCEQMGVKCVPCFWKGFLNDELPGETAKMLSEEFYDGADPVGKTHIREGVVVRIINRPTFTAFKNKNFYFKVLEGIIKDTNDVPDIEEAEEVL